MNPTLIPGFEDIITHIKQQEQRIKNLEQNEKVREARVQELYLENKQLKEENEKLDAKMLGYLADRNYQKLKNQKLQEEKDDLEAQLEHHEEYNRDLQQDHDDLEEENEKLKEENEKLKNLCADPKSVEHKNSVSNMILDNITYEDYLKMNEQMEEANKKLTEENKKLKEKIKEYNGSDKHLNKCIDSIRDQYLEQKEENKKLKNDLRLCAEGLIPNDLIQRGIVETCREKVKELEAENKKLKEDEEMMLSAVEVMKFGMEHKWDQKEKEWVSEEEYEERYGEE